MGIGAGQNPFTALSNGAGGDYVLIMKNSQVGSVEEAEESEEGNYK